MGSLFNEFEAYSDTANQISKEIDDVIKTIFTKYSQHSTRELEAIMLDSVTSTMAEIRLKRAMERKTKIRSEKRLYTYCPIDKVYIDK